MTVFELRKKCLQVFGLIFQSIRLPYTSTVTPIFIYTRYGTELVQSLFPKARYTSVSYFMVIRWFYIVCSKSFDTASTVSVLAGDCNLTSKTCNKPLTSVWETISEFSPDHFLTGPVDVSVALFPLGICRGGKTLPVPCNKTFWELEQSSAVHLRGMGHCRKKCCPFGHD